MSSRICFYNLHIPQKYVGETLTRRKILANVYTPVVLSSMVGSDQNKKHNNSANIIPSDNLSCIYSVVYNHFKNNAYNNTAKNTYDKK
jgi:hypothetical protein